MISVIIPAYNEEQNVAELHKRIVDIMRTLGENFEIIFIDDGSSDNTFAQLAKLSPIRAIRFAYNCGQTSAINAGIRAARGDIIVTLDGDLQNDPVDIPKMYKKIKEGYDAVVGWRVNRHDSINRKIFSKIANAIARSILKLDIHDYACAIKMLKKEFLDGVVLYGEMHVFLAGILKFRGARIAELQVVHHERKAGLSKHNFIKGAKDLADLFTIKFLFSTSRPLLIFGAFGLTSWAIATLAIILSVVLKLADLRNLSQTPLPIIASLFLILGFLLFMGGFLAELIQRSYYESRGQTFYRIRSSIENPDYENRHNMDTFS